MTHEETIQRLKELGFEHPVAAEGQIVLRGADLRNADLRGTDLGGAGLRGADLRGARYNHQTRWPHQFRLRTRGAVLVDE